MAALMLCMIINGYFLLICRVQPSRGEGWGRPMQEAMACGTPVIATNWSGNTAFMNDKNSWLVRIDGMERVGEGSFKDHMWAVPSKTDLREIMRTVSNNPEEVQQRITQARSDMQQLYSLDAIAARVTQRLSEINAIIASRSHDIIHDEL